MQSTRPSFAWLMSLGAPLLCLAILASLTTANYYSLRSTSVNGSGVRFHSQQMDFTVPRDKFLSSAFVSSASVLSQPIQSINFPGMFGEVITSMVLHTWPDSYRPKSFGPFPADLLIWRAMVFPFYCLPFWWFAGVGVDGLLETRRLRWPVLLIGTLFFILYIVLVTGLAIAGRSDRNDDGLFIWWGFGLWILLMAPFPAVWIRTGLRRRRTRLDPSPP